MAYKTIRARSVADMNAAIAAEIDDGNQPVGPLRAVLSVQSPVQAVLFQAVDTGTGVTDYLIVAGNSDAEFDAGVNDALGDSLVLVGETITIAQQRSETPEVLHLQVMADVDYLAGGSGGGGSIAIGDVAGLTAALAGKADTSHTHVKADVTDLVIVSTDANNDITAGTDGGAHYNAP